MPEFLTRILSMDFAPGKKSYALLIIGFAAAIAWPWLEPRLLEMLGPDGLRTLQAGYVAALGLAFRKGMNAEAPKKGGKR